MNALALVPKPEAIPSPVVPYVETNPVSVLLDEVLRTRFFDEIRGEIDEAPVDLTTKKGRDAIKSLAYKVAQTKMAIDAAGKKLNEDANKQIKAVNAVRKECWDILEELQGTARKPLTEWEAVEAAREAKIKETLDFLDRARIVLATDTSGTLTERLVAVEMIDGAEFLDAKSFAVKALKEGIERLAKEEADRAELERLRAEQAERERAEAARKAAEQREQEEAERKAREEKLAQERAEAAAKAAAEEAAAAERRKAEEAIAAERRAAEEAAGKARAEHAAEVARLAAEKKKLEEAEATRLAEEKRQAEEQERRERDRQHRGEVLRKAKEALIATGAVEETQAKIIVRAIVEDKIPNVLIRF